MESLSTWETVDRAGVSWKAGTAIAAAGAKFSSGLEGSGHHQRDKRKRRML
jgi:hypothetical protein